MNSNVVPECEHTCVISDDQHPGRLHLHKLKRLHSSATPPHGLPSIPDRYATLRQPSRAAPEKKKRREPEKCASNAFKDGQLPRPHEARMRNEAKRVLRTQSEHYTWPHCIMQSCSTCGAPSWTPNVPLWRKRRLWPWCGKVAPNRIQPRHKFNHYTMLHHALHAILPHHALTW